MKLSIKEKLGYSLGDTASHFVWDMVNFWLIFYSTDVLGISPAWSTAIAILGTIMDAVMDPIVGIWADRTNTRWGKFRPFLLYGCVPLTKLAELKNSQQNYEFTVGGMVVATREGKTKRDQNFAILTLEDYSDLFEFPLFGKDYADYSKFLKKDLIIMYIFVIIIYVNQKNF